MLTVPQALNVAAGHAAAALRADLAKQKAELTERIDELQLALVRDRYSAIPAPVLFNS